MIVFLFFLTISVFTLLSSERRDALDRNWEEWILDSFGLTIQGIIIPGIQILLSQKIYFSLLPSLGGSLNISPIPAFLLNFVFVDYIYYLNHRMLHHIILWPIHSVHHGAVQFDLWMSSRNTAWTSFFIVYLWINSLFIYLLRDPFPFALGAMLTASLDLWRHTRFSPKPGGILYSITSPILILPSDHVVHHGRDFHGVNFGANLNIWDRIHGTFLRVTDVQKIVIGAPTGLSLFRQAFWPFLRGTS